MTHPIAVRRVLKNLDPAWRAVVTEGTGLAEVTQLGDPRTNGTRPREIAYVDVASIAVRLAHPDRRRAVALWARRLPDGPWKVDGAWAWTVGEWPRAVKVTDLAALLAPAEAAQLELVAA